MKQIVTLLLFAAPFVINAQEAPKEKKASPSTPPASEKSISEKGVSSTKSRSVNAKQSETPAPAATPATKTTTATTSDKPKG